MAKQNNWKGKYQVNWRDKDEKGYYDTFILANDEEEAKVYAKTAHIQDCFRIQIIKL